MTSLIKGAPVVSGATTAPGSGPLQHYAFFYRDDEGYRDSVVDFVRGGLESDEPVLVAVPGPNLELVRAGLGQDARRIRLADMGLAGRNPGRIIGGVLSAFVDEHRGRRVRIVGEPIWAGRTDEEYPACAEHEALINVALGAAPAAILCPYDAARLEPAVLTDATRTHPVLAEGTQQWPSPAYTDPGAVAASFDRPLSEPPDDADMLVVDPRTGPRAARRLVYGVAERAGMAPARITDLLRAVQELAVNTIAHAGGAGLLIVWQTDSEVRCQLQDGGRISDPLAGRLPPEPPDVEHGLWLVHQTVDLVRIHRRSDDTTVRVHMRIS
ncbi:anti-sigma factor RsbA family regulatory protein [Pseudonocardia bannensis]|uniref:Sensor histidine kinase n=1 Tax=Pseudonocardia bannensis TaxID=630973 RepID=A0A848DSJ2_9PSEU|nr:sensor histidine kinase [Pseudonocardia bannensis]NMH95459.1 sensor histidine kinase [Pseudonocardia bannensis]